MALSTDSGARARIALGVLALSIGCAGGSSIDTPSNTGASWSVTAWGERYEIFAEIDALAVGSVAVAHTHVTQLSDFAPADPYRVEIVLVGTEGDKAFTADQADRPGIFEVEVSPARSGEADVLFRVHDSEGADEIRGGRVLVGDAESVGRVVRAPAPRGGSEVVEPLSFSKEQQWQSTFETTWVREGELARSVRGLAKVRPPAGGENIVSSPIGGIVQQVAAPQRWPFVGLEVRNRATLFRVVPLVAPGQSLASLQADVSTLTAELETAKAHLGALEELLSLEATSRREVEESRLRVTTLEARHLAASKDLEAARSAREGGSSGGSLQLRSPFAGTVAAVHTTPGSTVSAGDPLARLVRTSVIWVEVAVSPEDARAIASQGVRGLVFDDSTNGPVRIEEGLSLIATAPEVSSRTGTVTVVLEAPSSTGIALGTTADVHILLTGAESGIVVPATAVIDDGGFTVAYLQLSGETFVRQRVTVLERQGELVLVDDLVPGQRLVTRGGNAIRRSSLTASGAGHGHVH